MGGELTGDRRWLFGDLVPLDPWTNGASVASPLTGMRESKLGTDANSGQCTGRSRNI